MAEIDLFKIIHVQWDHVQKRKKKTLKKQQQKKCKYKHTMNAIPEPLGIK